MEIGKKIRELRIARNLTQEALAAELSVTPQAISKWECGTTTPDIQLLPDMLFSSVLRLTSCSA